MAIRRDTGLLILDNSCLRKLAGAPAREKFFANMRAADLDPTATEVNVVEAAASGSSAKREALLGTLKALTGDRLMLPWPFRLLKRLGQAVLENENQFKLEDTGYDWLLSSPEETAAVQADSEKFMRDLKERYAALHREARPRVQQYLKTHDLRDRFSTPLEFLDEYWNIGGMREAFATSIWKGIGLPGEPPIDVLMLNDAWRLMLDTDGYAVYQGAFEVQESRKVHRADWIQLVYLGAPGLRMLATNDKPFHRAAQAILQGRYGNARVVLIDELLE